MVDSINDNYASYDSQGHKINGPYPTLFPSGGFDLDAIAVLNENTYLGTRENERDLYSIFPNPSQGLVNITSSLDAEIEIIAINGQLIQHTSIIKGETIELNDLKQGLYVIYFKTSKKSSQVNSLLHSRLTD